MRIKVYIPPTYTFRDDQMIKYIFILPLALCFIWYLYLQFNNYTFEQGRKGYFYIAGFSAVVVSFFAIVWLITRT